MSRTPPSPSPRFSRTFDLLLNQFPDSTGTTNVMTSNRTSCEPAASRLTQWRSAVTAPSCAFCNKSVFPAEEINAAGQKFHKLCLKCTSCNTPLNPGNLNEHDKKIYCISCYRRQFGPRGVGRGLANSLSTAIDTPPTSPSLSRDEFDEKRVLTNTEWTGYPRNTSTGSSPSHNSSEEDYRHTKSVTYVGGVTTRSSISTVLNRPTTNSIANGSAFRMLSVSGNICPRCSKTVYLAEEVKAIGKSFHKRCYTCAHCKGSINAARYSEHEGEIYDNNCYQRLFGPKGVGSATLSTGKY